MHAARPNTTIQRYIARNITDLEAADRGVECLVVPAQPTLRGKRANEDTRIAA
jgi:hypothetical protein